MIKKENHNRYYKFSKYLSLYYFIIWTHSIIIILIIIFTFVILPTNIMQQLLLLYLYTLLWDLLHIFLILHNRAVFTNVGTYFLYTINIYNVNII